MNIVLLAAASSIHTVRWANGLYEAGNIVHVISQHPVIDSFKSGVSVHVLPYRSVLGYFTMVPAVRELLLQINPDIVNAHYASGYATTARLVGVRPWVLSVWGSDIFEFPHKSPLHKWLVKGNLIAADQIASTSNIMANEVRKLVPSLDNIAITPFGVDVMQFIRHVPEGATKKNRVVVGTVKTMKPVYGIDILIEAFAILIKSLKTKQSLNILELELRLVGDGKQIPVLQQLANRLGIGDKVRFLGRVPHAHVPDALSKLDIYVALSRFESFGVAILEAGAAGRPVVVSDASGLPEVTVDGVTGFVVPRNNPTAAAVVIERLVLDADLRFQMGQAAQSHVAKHYSWDVSVQTMIGVYERAIQTYRAKQA